MGDIVTLAALGTLFTFPFRGKVGMGVVMALQCVPDYSFDCFNLTEHFVIPETQHSKSIFLNFRSSLRIASRILRMLTTVNLDHQPRFKTNKIHNKTGKRVLAAKLIITQLFHPEMAPQKSLGIRHILSEIAGTVSLYRR